jgi:hypothetical protein
MVISAIACAHDWLMFIGSELPQMPANKGRATEAWNPCAVSKRSVVLFHHDFTKAALMARLMLSKVSASASSPSARAAAAAVFKFLTKNELETSWLSTLKTASQSPKLPVRRSPESLSSNEDV